MKGAFDLKHLANTCRLTSAGMSCCLKSPLFNAVVAKDYSLAEIQLIYAKGLLARR